MSDRQKKSVTDGQEDSHIRRGYKKFTPLFTKASNLFFYTLARQFGGFLGGGPGPLGSYLY
jgi:hypothetical protein